MKNYIRKIPRVAVAGLVLGGCGGGSGGGGEESPSPDALAALLCDVSLACGEEEFYLNYDSLDACASETEEYIAADLAYYAETDGQACADAFLMYYDCYADMLQYSCMAYGVERVCAAEIADMIDSCPSWSDGAYGY